MKHDHTGADAPAPTDCASCKQLLSVLSEVQLGELRGLLLLLAATGTEVTSGAVELVELELANRAG